MSGYVRPPDFPGDLACFDRSHDSIHGQKMALPSFVSNVVPLEGQMLGIFFYEQINKTGMLIRIANEDLRYIGLEPFTQKQIFVCVTNIIANTIIGGLSGRMVRNPSGEAEIPGVSERFPRMADTIGDVLAEITHWLIGFPRDSLMDTILGDGGHKKVKDEKDNLIGGKR